MRNWFTDHPRSLGMSWAEHAAGAVGIGARMAAAGIACMVHAAIPALFTETAGRTVLSLAEHMAQRKAGARSLGGEWPDYEI